MCGDWSFPETSERIRRRRRGEGWHVANPFRGGGGGRKLCLKKGGGGRRGGAGGGGGGGGGKDIFLNKLGA